MNAREAGPEPVEIRLDRPGRALEIAYADGTRHRLPAELLRVESPSAEVQGHSPTQKTIVAGKRGVGITTVEPVGTYAIRLVFDDGHDTGIYTWANLFRFGRDQDALWAAYEAALAQRGLSRG